MSDTAQVTCLSSPSSPGGLKREFRSRLLAQTVWNAAHNVPAYAAIAEHLSKIDSLEKLEILPIVDKSMMLERPQAFRNSHQKTELTQHTSGTSGKTMVMHRSKEEIEFIERFYTSVNDPPTHAAAEQPEICISLTAPSSHGAPTPLPYNGPVLSIDPFDPAWLRQAAAIVSRPWEFLDCEPGTAVLVGLEPHLRLLTAILLEQCFNFGSSVVSALNSTGDLITAYRRRWFETSWGVQLFDRYSMSETFAGASHCDRCGRMHPDMNVIVETVDPASLLPVRNGIGVMVFTTLYPFVQKQPLIRYWSGDVVEVAWNQCPNDELGFTFKGRLSHCLLDRRATPTKPLLLGADVMEVLDQLPDVARTSKFADVYGIRDGTLHGNPKCRISSKEVAGKHVVIVEVELRYSPIGYPKRSKRLTRIIETGIVSRVSTMSDAARRGDVSFRVELKSPGALQGFEPASISADDESTELRAWRRITDGTQAH
jgi:hypothetical protein